MHSNESTEDRCSRHYTLLQRCPLLHGLPDLLRHVATHASERRLRDKDVLFLKHDPEDFIGLVLGGHLYTVLYGPDGRELIVNDIRPGEVIGETALIQPNRRETSAYASGAASVLILHRRHFAPLIADTEFLNRALALLCSRLREASGFVERVCLHRLESRLARHLLASLASEQPEGACATLPTNQSILAAMLNASRPKLNAQLVNMETRRADQLPQRPDPDQRPRSPTTQGRTAGRAPVTQVTASPTARLTDCSPTRATREVAVMDRPNQPGGNETGSDRLFEESWRAAQAGLRKRAQRLARGNSHRAEEWLSSTAVKAMLFLRQSPERVRDPQGFLFLVLEHVYLDSARHQIREDRLIDRGIDLHDGQLERFAAVGSPLERLEQLERLDQVDKALASLSRQQQQLFELRFIEELPYADIASQLGIAPPLVRKRVQLLRSRLSADFFAGDVSQDRRSRVHS